VSSGGKNSRPGLNPNLTDLVEGCTKFLMGVYDVDAGVV
jgi:hypothetical protein